jgi:hypothetical protein
VQKFNFHIYLHQVIPLKTKISLKKPRQQPQQQPQQPIKHHQSIHQGRLSLTAHHRRSTLKLNAILFRYGKKDGTSFWPCQQ